MRKATFAELKSGSERFIAICVSRSKSLPELYIGYSRDRRDTTDSCQCAPGASVHTIKYNIFVHFMFSELYNIDIPCIDKGICSRDIGLCPPSQQNSKLTVLLFFGRSGFGQVQYLNDANLLHNPHCVISFSCLYLQVVE